MYHIKDMIMSQRAILNILYLSFVFYTNFKYLISGRIKWVEMVAEGWEQKVQGSHLHAGCCTPKCMSACKPKDSVYIWSCLGQSILGSVLAATCSSFSNLHQWQDQHLAATTTKQTEDLHLHRWKRSLGRDWQGERWQPNGNHWSEVCQVLEKYMFFYLGQRCWLPYCVWVSGQIKLCILSGIINGSVMDLYYLRKWTGRQRSFCLLPCKCQI